MELLAVKTNVSLPSFTKSQLPLITPAKVFLSPPRLKTKGLSRNKCLSGGIPLWNAMFRGRLVSCCVPSPYVPEGASIFSGLTRLLPEQQRRSSSLATNF